MIDKNNSSLLLTLHETEVLIMNKISSINGTMDEISDELVSLRIKDNYEDIFLAYSEFIEDQEALKRAIFLQWYSVSEPFPFTGLKGFDEKTQRRNLQVLINQENECKIDMEFCVMFLHYYAISDWYFNSFFDFSPFVAKFSKRKKITNFIFPEMTNRGQMGRYWQSLNLTNILKDL